MNDFLRIALIQFDPALAEAIAKNVIEAFRSKYDWFKLLGPMPESDFKEHLTPRRNETFNDFFKVGKLVGFLHDNYYHHVLGLTGYMVVHDLSGTILNGASESLSLFTSKSKHCFVSTYLPEFSLGIPSEIQASRASVIAVHELGHLWGLGEHNTELNYTNLGKLCVMSKVHHQDNHDLASRIKGIESRDTTFCADCYSKLGL